MQATPGDPGTDRSVASSHDGLRAHGEAPRIEQLPSGIRGYAGFLNGLDQPEGRSDG